MSAAGSAGDFSTPAVCVEGALNRPGYFCVEAGPAAAGVKLVLRAVERCFALAAMVGARLEMVSVLTGKG